MDVVVYTKYGCFDTFVVRKDTYIFGLLKSMKGFMTVSKLLNFTGVVVLKLSSI